MAEILRMPRLSDTMEEGNIVEWQKKVGDKVVPGDVLAEVETDKATMELESYYEGTLLHISVQEGIVPVDGLLAIIGDESEDVEKLLAETANVSETKSEVVTHDGDSHQNMEVADSTPPAAHQQTDTPAAIPIANENDGRIKASPLAKKIAEEKNLNLAQIQGTGEGGRIVKRDVESATSAPPAVQNISLPSIQVPSTVEYGNHKVSQIRKVIAKRLSQSKFTAPHFYLTVEINMGKIAAARKEINADPNIKISFNDFVVKAAAMALQKHPAINSSWHDDHITVHQDINIGVAVAIDEGLVVPVVKNANLKPMTLISSEIKDLATRGRDRKLSPQEMAGNTFTISNLGSFGIDEFTAIINPPDACILAVSSIVKKPIVVNDEIKVGNMMKVTLSCDHRIVDGATGALFLNTLKQYLENPIMMIV